MVPGNGSDGAQQRPKCAVSDPKQIETGMQRQEFGLGRLSESVTFLLARAPHRCRHPATVKANNYKELQPVISANSR
jgi:hypothetical protein